LKKYSPVGKSFINAYDERTAVRPLPLTSHAMPTRGEKFHHFLVKPDVPGGKPGSPGEMRPAAALWNTVLTTFRLKRSRSKIVLAPCVRFSLKNGSHRSPALIVRRLVALQGSSAYTPPAPCYKSTPDMAACWGSSMPPIKRPANPSPDAAPVKLHCPPPRAHVATDTLKYAMFAPTAIWWLPRTIVRSSLI